MRIFSTDRIDALPDHFHASVGAFLSSYIPESTVGLPPTSYRAATSWSLALDDAENIVGFAAQRVFRTPRATIIQIMGTYLAPTLRGRLMANTLLQGVAFLRALLGAPTRPIVWCARTRAPAVYRTATRFNRIYPRLDEPEENRRMWSVAEPIARLVYGGHATLVPETFVLKDSYPEGSVFMSAHPPRAHPVDRAFARAIRYDRNEALFIMCRLNPLEIVRFLAARTVWTTVQSFAPWSRWRAACVETSASPTPVLSLDTVDDVPWCSRVPS